MPGSPATSANYSIPRYSNADPADFSAQVNAVVDQIDSAVKADVLTRRKRWNMRAVGSNVTAAESDFVVANAAITVTLPATPAAGDMVGVIAGTGSATVARSGSPSIFGVGLNFVTSFTLAAPGAHAVLLFDGTNWLIVQGQQDSGWVAITAGTNMSTSVPAGVNSPQAQLRGDRVTLRGWLKNTGASGGIFGGTIIGIVPVGLRPAKIVRLGISLASGTVGNLTYQTIGAVDSSGNIYYLDNNGNAIGLNSWATLDGNEYATT